MSISSWLMTARAGEAKSKKTTKHKIVGLLSLMKITIYIGFKVFKAWFKGSENGKKRLN
jgi:hypothetical protein